MKRLKIKYAHKLAWWFRRWAEKLEPGINTAPWQRVPPVLQYRGKAYEIKELRLAVSDSRELGATQQYHEIQINKANDQLTKAAEKAITGYYEYGPEGMPGKTVLQLLVLAPKNYV